MRIRIAVPDEHLTPGVLDAALEAVTRADEALLDAGQVPTAREGIARGVRWKPEPPGDEHFDLASKVRERGWGDCDDLAPWHAASLRASGEDPDARAVVKRSGPSRWHALVVRGDGRIDDPSKWAGMGKGVHGGSLIDLLTRQAPAHVPVVRSTQPDPASGWSPDRIILRCQPWRGKWAARTDVPWATQPGYGLASYGYGLTPEASLLPSLKGAALVGEASCVVGAEAVARCGAIHDALCCGDLDDLEDIIGWLDDQGFEGAADDIVGFLPLLSAALPLASSLLPGLLPGGGGGAAQAPAAAAAPAASMMSAPVPGGHGGGMPGGFAMPGASTPYGPMGPVIVRF